MVGLFFLVIASTLVWSPTAFAASQSVFTRYNIHVQERFKRSGEPVYKASYANYTNPGEGHLIVQAGTKITVLKKNRKGFQFQVESDKKVVAFEFHEQRMKMSVDEYIALITSVKPVSFGRLSKVDNKGRSKGKIFVGMSREGVLTAFGYPATHRTPSLDSETWIFWSNRFRTVGVHFNEKGKVESIQ
jgi:hypothetical protein